MTTRTGSLGRFTRAGVVCVAILAVGSIGRSGGAAQATQGQPVVLGADNTGATQRTGFFTTNNAEVAVLADPGSLGGHGSVGVYSSGATYGVYAEGNAGVYGSGFSYGVRGTSDNATGVSGSGRQVGVEANGAVGVDAFSNDSDPMTPAVRASATGLALEVTGKASFSRSGKVTIAYPSTSAKVTGVSLDGSSLVVGTLQKYIAGVWVAAAVPILSGSPPVGTSFTIYLNKAPGTSAAPKSVTVAWFVLN